MKLQVCKVARIEQKNVRITDEICDAKQMASLVVSGKKQSHFTADAKYHSHKIQNSHNKHFYLVFVPLLFDFIKMQKEVLLDWRKRYFQNFSYLH